MILVKKQIKIRIVNDKKNIKNVMQPLDKSLY